MFGSNSVKPSTEPTTFSIKACFADSLQTQRSFGRNWRRGFTENL
jgi:hypothetical protein